MVSSIEKDPRIDQLTSLELIRNNVETETLQRISLADVLTEASIIDASHASDLAESMAGKRGQLSPIVVRAREENGRIVYDVIDGFHRSEGKKMQDEKEIDAKVVYGCSDEELFDLRILAASSVRSVQYPRIAEWIAKSFSTTEWPKKGLTVAQVFGLAVSDRTRTRIVDISQEELERVKAWALEKSKKWGKPITSIHEILRIVEDADPVLVKQVRYQGGGRDRITAITPQRLHAVVSKFPGKENFPIQSALLKFAVKHRLTSAETTTLANSLETLISNTIDLNKLETILDRINPNDIIRITRNKLLQAEEDQSASENEGIEIEEQLDTEPTDNELKALEETADIITYPKTPRLKTDKLDYGNHRVKEEIVFAEHPNHGNGRSDVYDEPISERELKAEISSLKSALELAHRTLESQSSSEGNAPTEQKYWWQTAPYLSVKERFALDTLIAGTADISEIADQLKILPMQVFSLIQSAVAKHMLHKRLTPPKF